MSKVASKKRSNTVETEIVNQFKGTDTSDLPAFCDCVTYLEMGLWVLWASKEKVGVEKLTTEDIASILRDVMEVSADEKSITKSFNRAGKKIHTYYENGNTFYVIMKSGKDYLQSHVKEGYVEVFYFEPGKRYTPKRLLTKDILAGLTGELRIVDPYSSERTLDCLRDIRGRPVKFLTKLPQKARDRFLRELQDFKSEYPAMEFRDYPNTDLHDRYIISPSSLVILGHSIKDLGGKESFAIVLNEEISRNLIEALSESFDRRWKQSNLL